MRKSGSKPTPISIYRYKGNSFAPCWKTLLPRRDYGGGCPHLNFNMWMDSPEVFIPAEVWNKNSHGIAEEDLQGQLCYGGIEL